MKVRKDKVARTKDSTSGATSQATGSTGRNEKNSTEQETNVARVSASTSVAQPVEVYKQDIISIGFKDFNVDGYLVISCFPETSQIDFILLRSVLKCFGEQYTILGMVPFKDEDDSLEMHFVTNLPYAIYEETRNSIKIKKFDKQKGWLSF